MIIQNLEEFDTSWLGSTRSIREKKKSERIKKRERKREKKEKSEGGKGKVVVSYLA